MEASISSGSSSLKSRNANKSVWRKSAFDVEVHLRVEGENLAVFGGDERIDLRDRCSRARGRSWQAPGGTWRPSTRGRPESRSRMPTFAPGVPRGRIPLRRRWGRWARGGSSRGASPPPPRSPCHLRRMPSIPGGRSCDRGRPPRRTRDRSRSPSRSGPCSPRGPCGPVWCVTSTFPGSPRRRARLGRRLHQLYPARLAAPARVDLCLHDAQGAASSSRPRRSLVEVSARCARRGREPPFFEGGPLLGIRGSS